ncbi:hypothetical protein KP001_15205 [Geomonas subterranea]|uniref:Lipoprotein n=1 Tax=Geomonas subterranea TaxID=2847989 RepID=A0ABX8LHR6_9BACT|nr:hypothetical protein [Geomonas subterranea]QXE89768.1 hypothetical protein KP001_15205 [Geomonas subterranea]QXM08114.1 hypothetical protein KP002_14075 [Geomonas subterranea]
MKKRILWLVLAAVLVALAGCGGGNERRVQEILRDPNIDGYIRENLDAQTLQVVQPATRLFAGLDPLVNDEYRAFIEFPLAGELIPAPARVVSASIELFINDVSTDASRVPMLIELVPFQPVLGPADYDRPAFTPRVVSFYVYPSDRGKFITIPVTSLFLEAALTPLPTFQLRISQDIVPSAPGRVEIDDTTVDTAPLLRVVYD